MSKKRKEQSAIDMIYAMEAILNKLDKKVDLLDGNVKILSNKMSKLQKTINGMATLPKAESVEPKPINSIDKSGKRSDKYITGPIRMYGTIVSKGRNPISGVQVAIYNSDGDVIKTRKTDSKGHWEVRLPAGKYGIEYTHKKFKPINLVAELKEGVNEFEVK